MTIKIRIKIGGVEVDYEGAEGFLDKKLPKLIGDVSALSKEAPTVPTENGNTNKSSKNRSGISSALASFLREKNIDTHNKRFLATALWLYEKKRLTTHQNSRRNKSIERK